ncbi:hypothetical protein [Mesoterricola silvestris]|uniref:Porin n=1 Tax=Mesoterricola silvestris TaxID=2927979 RepID=A0AA48GSJ4_9BACT|nr:hypothetical protein [Mesoterricola silvestris]BDU73217.1 hypothetical protein METEAL_23910 [Mesoterricola silvestris]
MLWWGAGALAFWAAATLVAQEPGRNLQFSAFGTLGAARGDTREVGFRRDASSSKGIYDRTAWDLDTRFGVQASGRIGENLLGTFQVVSRLRSDNTFRPRPTWASLAWSASPGLLVRAGLLSFDILPLGDLANVGFTYLWVRPPVEVFAPVPLTGMRGLDAEWTFLLDGGGALQVKAFAGSLVDHVPADHLGEWDVRGGRVFGGAVKFTAGRFRARLGGTVLRFPNNLPEPVPALQGYLRTFAGLLGDPGIAASADAFDTRGRTLRSANGSVAWDGDPWQVQGALSHAASDSILFQPAWSGFASLGCRVGPVVPFGMFARNVTRRTPLPYLGALPALTGPGAPAARGLAEALRTLARGRGVDQHTLSAGLRWDFAPTADLKVQVDRIRSHDATGLFYNPRPGGPATWDGRETVLSLTLDFTLGGGR